MIARVFNGKGLLAASATFLTESAARFWAEQMAQQLTFNMNNRTEKLREHFKGENIPLEEPHWFSVRKD